MAAQKANTSKSVAVRVGDTAGRIAHTVKPSSVSLDQMLVAMLRQNPQAFIDGNINRIKAGAIVDVPDAQAAGEVSADEAKRIIAAQSKDFDAFRRRLATAVPRAPAANTQRQVTGKVQSEVTDKKAASPSADQLKLSKAATASSTAAEDTIAREREAQATADRAAELTRNLAELAKIGAATPAPAPAPAPVSATAVAPAPALATESATPLPTPAPAPAEPVVAAPAAPAEPAVAAPAVPAPTEPPPAPAVAVETNAFPSEEPDLLSEFTSNPLVLPAAGGLLALLAGFGAWRWHQRRKQSSPDSSYLESRIQPDSFFGASGGQNVNTVEVVAQGSSLMYSPSQLDAGGDVDPVAEADVYLAYGRDLQAEEILKEALRTTPTRVAIHSKMLEIYAKRRDAKSFEVLACEVYALAHGDGPEWEHACQLGLELDPANPMYQPGGSPAARGGAAEHDADVPPGMANTRPFDSPNPPPVESDSALDLDLDFSVDEATKISATDTNVPDNSAPFNTTDTPPTNSDGAVTDMVPPPFDLSATDLSFEGKQPQTNSEPVTQSDDLAASDSNLSDFELSFADENPPTTQLEINPSVVAQDGNAAGPTFDMSDLSLDLGPETPADDGTLDDIPAGDPLETKLSLAAEFLAIGDMEGARSLAEEVVEQATGALQAKARTFLSDLS
jgi:pilus assembly protein FimV